VATVLSFALPELISARVASRSWLHGAYVVGWEVQSQLATLALVSLVVVASPAYALPAMLAWSLVATFVCHAARQRGFPDLLEGYKAPPKAGQASRLRCLAGSVIAVWFAGIQAYVFSRAAKPLWNSQARGLHLLARTAVLGVGLTLFGVATAEHLLRRAGYQGRMLLSLGLLGSVLNVTYRVFLSAAITHAAFVVLEALFQTPRAIG